MKRYIAGLLPAVLLAVFAPVAAAQNGRVDDAAVAALEQAFYGLDNGFRESAECPITYGHWMKPFSHTVTSLIYNERRGAILSTPEAAIVTWYYSGPEAFIQADDMNLRVFADCFDGTKDCGIKKKSRIAKAFTRPWGMKDSDKKAVRKYFSEPPPPAAIAFASRGLGQCFGDDPAQPSMESMGFALADVPVEDCADLAENAMNYNYDNSRNYHAWQDFFGSAPKCGGPVWAPQQALDNLAKKRAADYAFANRPIEERVGGLNGCQIAYSLIFNGLNGKTVGRIPDGAISWALDYEQAVIDDVPCPIMPQVLSDWVQNQPLDKFEPAPDPFDFFLTTGPNYTTLNDQIVFVSRVMQRYETAADPQIQIPADYCEDFHAWLNQSHFSKPTERRPERKFLYDYSTKIANNLRPALCVAVPRSVMQDYSSERSLQAARAEEAQREYEKREAAKRAWDAEMDALLRWKPSYRPPASEPRCYRTSETVETCFYD